MESLEVKDAAQHFAELRTGPEKALSSPNVSACNIERPLGSLLQIMLSTPAVYWYKINIKIRHWRIIGNISGNMLTEQIDFF